MEGSFNFPVKSFFFAHNANKTDCISVGYVKYKLQDKYESD